MIVKIVLLLHNDVQLALGCGQGLFVAARFLTGSCLAHSLALNISYTLQQYKNGFFRRLTKSEKDVNKQTVFFFRNI